MTDAVAMKYPGLPQANHVVPQNSREDSGHARVARVLTRGLPASKSKQSAQLICLAICDVLHNLVSKVHVNTINMK